MILWKLCRRGHELRPENVYFGTGPTAPSVSVLSANVTATMKYEKTSKAPTPPPPLHQAT
jgi:hypothetical protein